MDLMKPYKTSSAKQWQQASNWIFGLDLV